MELTFRRPLTLHLFSPYDANIIGGALVGVGMALSGACPGTVFPQVTAGFASAPISLAGAVVGGFLWVLAKGSIKREAAPVEDLLITQGWLGPQHWNTLAYSIFAYLTLICLSTLIDRGSYTLVHGLYGGLAIGFAQLGSVFLTKNTIGSSAAYEEAGLWLQRLLSGASDQATKPPYRSLIFTAGLLLGSLALVLSGNVRTDHGQGETVSATSSFAGGVLLSFGARLAGGCTSGHGISGMATLSKASFVSVAAMFGGGMLAVRLVGNAR